MLKKYKVLILFLSIFLLNINATADDIYSNFDGKYTYGSYQTQSINTNRFDDEEILFLVDFSGSMNESLKGNKKIYIAIDSIQSILADTDNQKRLGLRIFGIPDKPIIPSFNGKTITFDMKSLCTATKLMLPIAKYNNKAISDKLLYISPLGQSPIGYSLKQSVKNDFSLGKTLKHIILVTDGGENCGDDPCLFITNLMRTRDDIRIDVIAISVDSNAYSQLNCLATVTRGDFYSVNTPQDIKISLKKALNSTNIKPSTPEPDVQTKTDMTPSKPQISLPKQNHNIKYRNFTYEFNN